MAIDSATSFEIHTGGTDTNGGGFSTSPTMTADLAATVATGTAPVVTSASYTFVAADVNHWLFVKSGTNWTPGWYKIASVSAGAATLDAAIGHVIGYNATTTHPAALNTVAGVATTASPTSGTWSIDYSQVDGKNTAGSNMSTTDAVTAGTTTITSVSANFQVSLIGNYIYVQGGTGTIVAAWYRVTARASATSITVDRSTGLSVGTTATMNIGGAFATPGAVGAIKVQGSCQWLKAGTYTFANTVANTAGGPISDTTGGSSGSVMSIWQGFNTYRTDLGTRPVLSAGAQTAFTMLAISANRTVVNNIDLDGNSGATVAGINASSSTTLLRMKVSNCPGTAVTSLGYHFFLEVVACTGSRSFTSSSGVSTYVRCTARDTTTASHIGFNNAGASAMVLIGCIASALTGASADAFVSSTSGPLLMYGCDAYNIGRTGFDLSTTMAGQAINCIAYTCVTGFTGTSPLGAVELLNCAGGNNTTNVSAANVLFSIGFVALSGNPFTNAGSNDFSLNNTAGAGASLRAAGFNTFPGGTTASYEDIGAAQSQATGGSAGMLYIPSMDGL